MSRCRFTNDEYCIHNLCWKDWLNGLEENRSELGKKEMKVSITDNGFTLTINFINKLDDVKLDRGNVLLTGSLSQLRDWLQVALNEVNQKIVDLEIYTAAEVDI